MRGFLFYTHLLKGVISDLQNRDLQVRVLSGVQRVSSSVAERMIVNHRVNGSNPFFPSTSRRIAAVAPDCLSGFRGFDSLRDGKRKIGRVVRQRLAKPYPVRTGRQFESDIFRDGR